MDHPILATTFHPVSDKDTPMTEPNQDSGAASAKAGSEEVDTCRICRGMGSNEEELFYPCKCSGSIKYVHQNCLMEWLSHSQKKHCELCKTPFRFTKLYDTHMPKSVPIPIFLRQAAIHIWKTAVTWSRLNLVGFVWLFWLPWCMRAVWRGLFWLADGGWVDWRRRNLEQAALMALRASETNGDYMHDWTVVSLFRAWIWMPIVKFVLAQATEPFTFMLMKKAYRFMFRINVNSQASGAGNLTAFGPYERSPSWLSDIPLLNSLTRSTIFNNILIDTLEGQIITMSVVISFILIFLIREWVMQQQQNIHMGPGNQNDLDHPHVVDRNELLARDADGVGERPNGGEAEEAEPNGRAAQGPRPRVFARPRGRLHRRRTQHEEPTIPHGGHLDHITAEFSEQSSSIDLKPSTTPTTQRRPSMPNRDSSFRAAEIRRHLDEGESDPGSTQGSPWNDTSGISSLERPNDDERIDGSSSKNALEDPYRTAMLPEQGDKADDALRARPSTSDLAQSDDSTIAFRRQSPEESSTPVDSRPSTSCFQQPDIANNIDERRPLFPPSDSDFWSDTEPENLSRNGEPSTQTLSPTQPLLELVPGQPVEERTASVDNSSDAHDEAASHSGEVDRAEDDLTQSQVPSLLERVTEYLWGHQPEDPGQGGEADDEHVVNDLEAEAPFVPVANGQALLPPRPQGQGVGQDAEVLAAAQQAGIDPNALDGLDDAEDLEGIMDLIGVQGPLVGLIQNGVFCALLVSLTITAAIWTPYVAGKVFLTILANPMTVLIQPLHLASTFADMVVDFSIFAAGCSYYWIDTCCRALCKPIFRLIPTIAHMAEDQTLPVVARSYSERALERLARSSMSSSEIFGEALDIPRASVISREALHSIQHGTAAAMNLLETTTSNIWHYSYTFSEYEEAISAGQHKLGLIFAFVLDWSKSFARNFPSLLRGDVLRIKLASPVRAQPYDFQLALWNAKDRGFAIFSGYIFLAILGLIYLRLSAALRGTNRKGRVESGLAEVLYQAGGIIKVIFIIGIEMLVFPLYCGILLDIALLPLFANATILSRFQFALTSPSTAGFVHWFVGTCYMFHFALFVSMCRKIMRPGVLFFIRDPDDPTFHPVRDVLERNVSTQLWKISLSALIYGALILFCLGGVVWGLDFTFDGIFPINWSSSEPLLEFPVDIMFYNFLMPVVAKVFQPSTAMSKSYGWWFKMCARWLRLSSFLLGDRRTDEQHMAATKPWKHFLGKSWLDTSSASESVRYDGRFVLAPASDQVRIPKGQPTFVDAASMMRSKYRPDRTSDQFKEVYLPPSFRTRISVFIFLIWAFAASTGLGLTVAPLLFGRFLLSFIVPDRMRMNDIYAYSTGIYLFGGIFYLTLKYQGFRERLQKMVEPHLLDLQSTARRFWSYIKQATSLIYIYSFLVVVLPAMVALVMQCYLVIPLHTYLAIYGDESSGELPRSSFWMMQATEPTGLEHGIISSSLTSRPMIHLAQDWTLGVLYIKVLIRLILWTAPSRPALALRNVVRNGWTRPDVRLASRGFILPALLVLGFLLAAPLGVGWLVTQKIDQMRSFPLGLDRLALKFKDATNTRSSLPEEDIVRILCYRFSYVAVMLCTAAISMSYILITAFSRWRRRIRDEVYLIGERLHNYAGSTPSNGHGAVQKTKRHSPGKDSKAETPSTSRHGGTKAESSQAQESTSQPGSSGMDKGKGKGKGKGKAKAIDTCDEEEEAIAPDTPILRPQASPPSHGRLPLEKNEEEVWDQQSRMWI